VTLSVVGEEQFEFEARSVTYDGKRCTAKLSLVEGQPPGPRKALPCRPSG
jgi:hypothetical protein